MSETDLIERLADAIANRAAPAIPVSIDLWDSATIAKFLKRDSATVRERITCLPDFPRAIRIPAKRGTGHPLYKATEVIEWAEKYREKR